MTQTIWKYVVDVVDEFTLDIPEKNVMSRGSILTVQMQGEGREAKPCIWVLLDPERPTDKRTFRWIGTGHPIPDLDMRECFFGYIGTIQIQDLDLVFHLFEKEKLTEL